MRLKGRPPRAALRTSTGEHRDRGDPDAIWTLAALGFEGIDYGGDDLESGKLTRDATGT